MSKLGQVVGLIGVSMVAGVLSGCTPEQGQQVPIGDLFTKADLDGKYVTTTGVLRVSAGVVGATSCDNTRCSILLGLPDGQAKPGERSAMTIKVLVGSGESEMANLPDKYSKSDLKVKAVGGKVLADGESVKVSGKVKCKSGAEANLPCSMMVERIDLP